jgi:hypothetical protein
MTIIQGTDGQYVISGGKILRIVNVSYSDDYFRSTGGWIKYELENGEEIII